MIKKENKKFRKMFIVADLSLFKDFRLFQVRLWTCRVFITELRIEHSLQSSFVRFLCGLKVGQALYPRLIPSVRLISA